MHFSYALVSLIGIAGALPTKYAHTTSERGVCVSGEPCHLLVRDAAGRVTDGTRNNRNNGGVADARAASPRAADQGRVAARGLGDAVGGLLDDLTGELGVREEPDGDDDTAEGVEARGLGDTVGGLLDDLTGELGVREELDDDAAEGIEARDLGDTVGGVLGGVTGLLGTGEEGGAGQAQGGAGAAQGGDGQAQGLGGEVGGLLGGLTGGLGVRDGSDDAEQDIEARGLDDTVGGLLGDVTGLLGVGQEQ